MHTWKPGLHSHAQTHGSVRFTDAEGRHFGTLDFQDGPIPEVGVNGTTNEEVIEALIERLQALNAPPFTCIENIRALDHLTEALGWLHERTRVRRERGVEGTTVP